MIFVRPFKVSDLAAFVPIEALTPLEIKNKELAQAIEDSGLAVTGIKSGKIIGCAGCHPVDEKTGEVWIRLNQECLDFKIGILRLMKAGMKIMDETYPFEVLTATVKCCFGTSVNMIERFGFKRVKEVTQDGAKWFLYEKRIA